MNRTINYNNQDINIETETREQAIAQLYKPAGKQKKTKIGDYK